MSEDAFGTCMHILCKQRMHTHILHYVLTCGNRPHIAIDLAMAAGTRLVPHREVNSDDEEKYISTFCEFSLCDTFL